MKHPLLKLFLSWVALHRTRRFIKADTEVGIVFNSQYKKLMLAFIHFCFIVEVLLIKYVTCSATATLQVTLLTHDKNSTKPLIPCLFSQTTLLQLCFTLQVG